MNFINNKKGSALLVSMLVMGVLVSTSLALSGLVLREIKIVKDTVNGGRSYFAAESALELALYKLNTELDGWETPAGGIDVSLSGGVVGNYDIDNTCNAYPCFNNDYDIVSRVPPLKEFYDVLELNKSITVPLFVSKDGVIVPVRDFTVEFFAAFNPQKHLNVKADNLNGWDVLRWKILGIKNEKTESIGDFTALSVANLADEGDSLLTNAEIPSWFGSISCYKADQSNRYTNKIRCGFYYGGNTAKAVDDPTQVAKVFDGNCDNEHAREYYSYGGDEKMDTVFPCYPIKAFLQDHNLNYLTLTNLINPAVFKPGLNKEALSKIYYRVELFGGDDGVTGNQTVREYADISASGISGKITKKLNVQKKRDSFMPVFNFSLYSTYMGEENDDGYWY